MKLGSKQRGMSGSGMLMVGLLIAFVGISAFKLYPSYYDDLAVSTALKNMEEDGANVANMSPNEIRQTLQKKILTSGMSLKKEEVTITKDKGKITIDVVYEVRTPMYGNIDAVTKFSHSITVSK